MNTTILNYCCYKKILSLTLAIAFLELFEMLLPSTLYQNTMGIQHWDFSFDAKWECNYLNIFTDGDIL